MPDFWTVSRGFMTFLLMTVLGTVLAYAVGMGHDIVYTYLQAMGIDGGVGTPWDSTREMWIITALMYFICALPPVLGLIIFGLSVTKRQRRDEYYETGEIYNQEE
jgi:hypothetical protein